MKYLACIWFLIFKVNVDTHAQIEDIDILSELQTEMSHWPPEEQESTLAILNSVNEIKKKIPANEFLFLIDSGFYSGLLDYPWGGEKRFSIDADILKRFQSELPLKKLPVFTKKIVDGALKDLELSLNPNFVRGVKGAPILTKEKEVKIQLVIPLLYQVLTKQEDELTKSLRPAYQFSLFRSVLNLKAFASIHNIAIPESLLKFKLNPDQIVVDENKSEKKESDIFHEIDLLTTPQANQPKPQATEDKSSWNPKN